MITSVFLRLLLASLVLLNSQGRAMEEPLPPTRSFNAPRHTLDQQIDYNRVWAKDRATKNLGVNLVIGARNSETKDRFIGGAWMCLDNNSVITTPPNDPLGEPFLEADFNDLDPLLKISQAFSQTFDEILIDHAVIIYSEWTYAHLKAIKNMVKKNGKFVFAPPPYIDVTIESHVKTCDEKEFFEQLKKLNLFLHNDFLQKFKEPPIPIPTLEWDQKEDMGAFFEKEKVLWRIFDAQRLNFRISLPVLLINEKDLYSPEVERAVETCKINNKLDDPAFIMCDPWEEYTPYQQGVLMSDVRKYLYLKKEDYSKILWSRVSWNEKVLQDDMRLRTIISVHGKLTKIVERIEDEIRLPYWKNILSLFFEDISVVASQTFPVPRYSDGMAYTIVTCRLPKDD